MRFAHIAKHGNGVKDVAFRVKDVAASLAAASKAGAKVVRQLDSKDGFTGGSIAAYGDTIHTFISRTNHAQFAPVTSTCPAASKRAKSSS